MLEQTLSTVWRYHSCLITHGLVSQHCSHVKDYHIKIIFKRIDSQTHIILKHFMKLFFSQLILLSGIQNYEITRLVEYFMSTRMIASPEWMKRERVCTEFTCSVSMIYLINDLKDAENVIYYAYSITFLYF